MRAFILKPFSDFIWLRTRSQKDLFKIMQAKWTLRTSLLCIVGELAEKGWLFASVTFDTWHMTFIFWNMHSEVKPIAPRIFSNWHLTIFKRWILKLKQPLCYSWMIRRNTGSATMHQFFLLQKIQQFRMFAVLYHLKVSWKLAVPHHNMIILKQIIKQI